MSKSAAAARAEERRRPVLPPGLGTQHAALSTTFDRLAEYYDLEHGDIQEDIPTWLDFARAADGPVLDLACGTGRVLLPLAQAGYAVTGVDISPEMLERARAKASSLALHHKPRLLLGDVRDLDIEPPTSFGLAIVALNSLMHLATQEEQRRALACAGAHLVPGGRLVFDLFNPDVVVDEAKDGQLFLHCLHYLGDTRSHLLHFQSPRTDRAGQTIQMHNYYDEIAPDGNVRRTLAPFRLRYLTQAEVRLLVPAAGLELDAVYGDYDLSPFTTDSPRLVVVARRRRGPAAVRRRQPPPRPNPRPRQRRE